VGCRVANPYTGDCSCPSGSTDITFRTIVDSPSCPGALIGAHATYCLNSAAVSAFGGAYQLDDNVPGNAGCRVANPITQACSCPSGFSASPLRVQVDGSQGLIGSGIFTCGRVPVSTITLCPGVQVDNTGAQGATAAFNACIGQTASGGTFNVPVGTYKMDGKVLIDKPMTLRTAGSAGKGRCGGSVACATLVAAPDLFVLGGFLELGDTHDVTVDHIILGGNRAKRLASAAVTHCQDQSHPDGTRYGYNARATNCTNCKFTNSISRGTLCGSSFEWVGNSATITNNAFNSNGDHNNFRMWADGLTLLHSDGAVVTGNDFNDNSDVDLVCGGATSATITGNHISQSVQAAFAGLMLDNFNDSQPGLFTGTTVANNTVSCSGGCDFGINLGPHPWYLSHNIQGGTVRDNTIVGAKVSLDAEGAGTTANPVTVFGNHISGTAIGRFCNAADSAFNISPDSVVDRHGETSTVTNNVYHLCAL
jgi:hypothetical protein